MTLCIYDADVKNRRGKQAKGRKVTGVQFDPQDSASLLVTSNDSRIRLYEGECNLSTFIGIAHLQCAHRSSMLRNLLFDQHLQVRCGAATGLSAYYKGQLCMAAFLHLPTAVPKICVLFQLGMHARQMNLK